MADPTLVGELHGRVAEALSSWREREEAGGRPPTRDASGVTLASPCSETP